LFEKINTFPCQCTSPVKAYGIRNNHSTVNNGLLCIRFLTYLGMLNIKYSNSTYSLKYCISLRTTSCTTLLFSVSLTRTYGIIFVRSNYCVPWTL